MAAANEAMKNQITGRTDTENDFAGIGKAPLQPILNGVLELQNLRNNYKRQKGNILHGYNHCHLGIEK